MDIKQTLGSTVRTLFVINATWALIGAVVSRGLTLAGSVAAGRILGAAGFGEINMIQSTQGLLGVLAGAGMGLAATKFVAEYRSTEMRRATQCVSMALVIAATLGLAASLVLFAGSELIASHLLNAPQLTMELQIATGLLFFGAINGVQSGALAGLGNFRVVALLGILRGACLCFLLIFGIALGGVTGGIIGLVVTEAIAVGANHIALQRLFPGLVRGNLGHDWRAEFGTLMRFSLLALLGSICTTASLWFANVILVGQPEGYAALGIFNAADRWRQLLLFLPASLSPLLMSMLSNLHGTKDSIGFREVFGLNLSFNVVVVVIPSVALALFAPLAMGLFGVQFQEGSTTLILLAASSVAVVLNTILGQILVSKGAIWGRFLCDVLLAALLASSALMLIPSYRDEGMAISSLIAYSATALVLVLPAIYYLKKKVV